MTGARPTSTMIDPRREFALLFMVMFTIAVGNTALQTVMPAIGRSLKLPDTAVAVAFSVSALLWVIAAPFWANRTARYGYRRMVLLGLGGFTLSLALCGIFLTLGILGVIAPGLTFVAFIISRLIYGTFGAAAPPATQALVAATTSRDQRTKALTLLASAFGLGTIVGPALAPFFILPGVSFAGPAFIFAGFGLVIWIMAFIFLPTRPSMGSDVHGAMSAYPSVGGQGTGATVNAALGARGGVVRWRDRRIRTWLVIGIAMSHGQAMIGQTMGFLIIDRLALPLMDAQQSIGIVLMMGAGAALLAQWGIIPLLGLTPRGLCLWGLGLAGAGCCMLSTAGNLHSISIAYALASLGFGFVRPGFNAGASLAVRAGEQASVAGKITSVGGGAFVLGPSIGVGLYEIYRPLPYLVAAVGLVLLLIWAAVKVARD